MTAEAVARPTGVPLFRRIYGLGSVFGKTLRDSRRAMLITAGFFSMLWVITGAAVTSTFGTIEARLELIALTEALPPILLGLYGGSQENVTTLGGFANWRYGFVMLVFPSIWSILALSGTLVSEARRGSLDLVAASPIPRWRVAVEKYLGHSVAVAIAMVIISLVAVAVTGATAVLTPAEIEALGGVGTDAVPLADAPGYGLLMATIALASGSIAFALAPFVGRGGAATIAGVVLAASWVIYGYREAIPLFDSLKGLSWYWWTHEHRPIAAVTDWASFLPLAAIPIIGAVVGVVAFARRDIGAIGSLRLPSLPGALRGIGGPFGRSLSERWGAAVGWGIPLGLMALMIAVSAEDLVTAITESPALLEMFRLAFPDVDVFAPGFGLQFAFLVFGYLATALAAATLVGGWATDETEGRLEMVLATATARIRWFVASGLGVYLAVCLVALIAAMGVTVGLLSVADEVVEPVLGSLVLALYGLAIAGIGLAVAGWVRASLGAAVAAAVAIGTILIDIIVPALRLPDWILDLSLTSHYGEPMLGSWDPVGVTVSLALAFGGLLLGAWGFARRDLRG
jgi:ABC-2 type transport system permease protein